MAVFLSLPREVIQHIAYLAYPGDLLNQNITLRDLLGATVQLSAVCKVVYGALRGDKVWLEGFCKYHLRGNMGLGRPKQLQRAPWRAIAAVVVKKESGIATFGEAYKKFSDNYEKRVIDPKMYWYDWTKPDYGSLPEYLEDSDRMGRLPIRVYLPAGFSSTLTPHQAKNTLIRNTGLRLITSCTLFPEPFRSPVTRITKQYQIEGKGTKGTWFATSPPLQHLTVFIGVIGPFGEELDLGQLEVSNMEGVTVIDVVYHLRRMLHKQVPRAEAAKWLQILYDDVDELEVDRRIPETAGELLSFLVFDVGVEGLDDTEFSVRLLNFVVSGKTAILFELKVEDDEEDEDETDSDEYEFSMSD